MQGLCVARCVVVAGGEAAGASTFSSFLSSFPSFSQFNRQLLAKNSVQGTSYQTVL